MEAAQTSGLSHRPLDSMDEQHTGSLLLKMWRKRVPVSFVVQAADCIVRDAHDIAGIFVSDPLSERIARIAGRDALSQEESARKIWRLDKAHALFYNGFSEQKWGKDSSCDLCMNIGRMGETAAVGLILQYLRACFWPPLFPESPMVSFR